jgi:hypothetical protein
LSRRRKSNPLIPQSKWGTLKTLVTSRYFIVAEAGIEPTNRYFQGTRA